MGVKDPKAIILEILKREGPVPVYRLAKALGVSYGAVQWYIYTLEKEGVVETVKIGKRRYVVLKASDWMGNVKVGDILDEFLLTLSALGVKPEMTLREALETLEKRAPHIAELLRRMMEKI
ncbi:putative transcriptional regulator [Pyrobaculum islandicum DSM 4184]|uniref:Transcriptional regulator n=1 Tax=Pyrobaculum islandicum (strain DSM 4184 / JCM 9189 / GEO3) TaxID=384616 RepID=A1RVK4_PYRIL|nr:helix-turn-helix domain-containing protein [Pyrobaculum islandicum]ABL88986.1 putative transcriptional regulator [Pyrobaculum islandicum DSM 4184]